ncbi:MAG: homoserine dehydrogenase [Pseudomonadota bacterium]
MSAVRLGIAGLGTVAQGVLEILRDNGAVIAARLGREIVVSRIASRSAKPDVDLGGAQFSTNLSDLLSDDVDIVVELIGTEDTAKTLIEQALANGKPVVTANKAVIARHGNELLSNNGQTPLRFEAAVAGAIPIVQALGESLIANRIESIQGIINGTCNYILTAMQEEGTPFDQALATAQKLGYAEADPTFDIEGIDAAHKLTILLSLAFDHPFDFDALHVEGISRVTTEDIQYANELGYRIKHLGIARRTEAGIEARVHPALVAKSNLLGEVDGVLNAVQVAADAAGTTLFSGPGAGGAATASAVLADVGSIVSHMGEKPQVQAARGTNSQNVLPIDQVRCPHYLRIPTKDEAGVFARVAQALSGHGINIEAVIQKEPSTDVASIVLLTQPVLEQQIRAALDEVQQLPQVAGDIARIRVE